MQRLSNDLLASLASSPKIQKPLYDRSGVAAGIVHLGIGAFHRAHQAVFTQKALNKFGGDWGVVGCSLRSASVAEQLNPQDGLYTVVERSSEGDSYHIIGAVQRVMVAPDDPAAVINLMASETIKVVSLTVTEKGYCHHPASGQLNKRHPDIVHDLANPDSPKTAIGYIVAALRLRKERSLKSFTVLSCDNLPHNGVILRAAVVQLAGELDGELARWIEAHSSFPSTMIDRIVPATTEADRAYFERELGYKDEGVVTTEPFAQWVIEDDFCNDRPRWEEVGALVVRDVAAFEGVKLRLLNGSHSFIAYCGYLCGFKTVSEAMADSKLERLVRVYMNEDVGDSLCVPQGFDVEGYKDQLVNRFKNTALEHRTWQIAMDGSQKLPQRLLGTLLSRLESGGSYSVILLAVAAWIRYVGAVDDRGGDIDVQDPISEKLIQIHRGACDSRDLIVKMLGVTEVFDPRLVEYKEFVSELIFIYSEIQALGMRKVVSGY